jgi:hypothetical protein
MRLYFTVFVLFGLVAHARAQAIYDKKVWVPGFYSADVYLYDVLFGLYAYPLSSFQRSFAVPGCNVNSVAVSGNLLFVACTSGFYNVTPNSSGSHYYADQIIIYGNVAAFIAGTGQLSKQGVITSPLFSELIAVAFDYKGNLWVSSFEAPNPPVDGYQGRLLRVPANQLNKANPAIDLQLVQSPNAPAGIAFDPSDNSLWIVGQDNGGALLNFPSSVVEVAGNVQSPVILKPAAPRYCIGHFGPPCQTDETIFNAPEGVAVLNGAIWIANNGGNAPASTLVRLVPGANGTLVPTVVGGGVDRPFACPGGLYSDGTNLWVNDEGFGVANTDCGSSAADYGDQLGQVHVFAPAGLADTPPLASFFYYFYNSCSAATVRSTAIYAGPRPPIPCKEGYLLNPMPTSSPGFGGIFVQPGTP